MAKSRIGRIAGAVRSQRTGSAKPADSVADNAGSGEPTGGIDSPPDSSSDSSTGGPPIAAGTIDPGTGFREQPATARRGRGRPRRGTSTAGSATLPRKASTKVAKVEVTQGSLANHILELHEFMAEMTAIKRLELTDKQARDLAKAISGANEHVKIPILTGKYMALAVLAWTASKIYLPMARDVAAGQFDQRVRQAPAPAVPVSATPAAPAAGAVLPATMPSEEELAGQWLTTH